MCSNTLWVTVDHLEGLVTLWSYLHTLLQSLHPNTRCRHTRSSVRWSGPSHRDCGTCSCRSDRCLSARHINVKTHRSHTVTLLHSTAQQQTHFYISRHTDSHKHTQPKARYIVEMHAIQSLTENELRIPTFEMSQQTGWRWQDLRIRFYILVWIVILINNTLPRILTLYTLIY